MKEVGGKKIIHREYCSKIQRRKHKFDNTVTTKIKTSETEISWVSFNQRRFLLTQRTHVKNIH